MEIGNVGTRTPLGRRQDWPCRWGNVKGRGRTCGSMHRHIAQDTPALLQLQHGQRALDDATSADLQALCPALLATAAAPLA